MKLNQPLTDDQLRTYPSGAARICAAVLVVAPDMDAVIKRGPESPAERIKREDDESDVVDDYGRPTVFDLMAERGPGRRDVRPHSSVQAWSRGSLFPAVIARVERYPEEDDSHGPRCAQRIVGAAECDCGKADNTPSVSYELTIGAFREEYATREDAEEVARYVCQNGEVNLPRYKELIHRGHA